MPECRLDKERRDSLVRIVQAAAEEDFFDEADAVAIIEICRNACDRAIAELTEEYLVSSIKSEPDDTEDSNNA